MNDVLFLLLGVGGFAAMLGYAVFATVTKGLAMFDYILGGITVVFLVGYLTYALVKPERF